MVVPLRGISRAKYCLLINVSKSKHTKCHLEIIKFDVNFEKFVLEVILRELSSIQWHLKIKNCLKY